MTTCSLVSDVLPMLGGALVVSVAFPLLALWVRRRILNATPGLTGYLWPFPYNLLVELYGQLTSRNMTADLLWCAQAWFLLCAVLAPLVMLGGNAFLIWHHCLARP
jgi:hypothetical protein